LIRSGRGKYVSKQLIVAGFHRSGTSMLTQELHKAGLFVGKRLMSPNFSNADGYFEDNKIKRLIQEKLDTVWKQLQEPNTTLCKKFHIQDNPFGRYIPSNLRQNVILIRGEKSETDIIIVKPYLYGTCCNKLTQLDSFTTEKLHSLDNVILLDADMFFLSTSMIAGKIIDAQTLHFRSSTKLILKLLLLYLRLSILTETNFMTIVKSDEK